jgi:hypothetical protein
MGVGCTTTSVTPSTQKKHETASSVLIRNLAEFNMLITKHLVRNCLSIIVVDSNFEKILKVPFFCVQVQVVQFTQAVTGFNQAAILPSKGKGSLHLQYWCR